MANVSERDFLGDHLRYEIGMLRPAHNYINQLPEGGAWNAYYECFAVHARNLVQFLSDKRTKNSFKASDFAKNYKQPDKDTIKGTMQMLVEQVFRPAKNRKKHSSEKVNLDCCNKLRTWIEGALSEFDARIDEDYRSYWKSLNPPPEVSIGGLARATNHVTSAIIEMWPRPQRR
jgi:hypothetical protein